MLLVEYGVKNFKLRRTFGATGLVGQHIPVTWPTKNILSSVFISHLPDTPTHVKTNTILRLLIF